MTEAPAERTAGLVSRRSLVIAAVSTVVEWYDFTLYLYFATTIARLFFGAGEVGLARTLGGFALAYLMRPLGALVFGHVGDRVGRRPMMLLSMGLMTAAMLATTLLPTAATIGPAAGWLLIALRCVMGFSVGAEYNGVVAYLLEGAPPERRGLITSIASAASEVGGLLAAGLSALVVSTLPAATVVDWGWRIPFLFGAALAGSIWFARSTLEESPEFERQVAGEGVPESPIRYALSHHPRAVMRGFAISALGSITYYVGITYVPAFLTTAGGLGEGAALWLSTAAALLVIAVTPVVGLLSDRFGRRSMLLVLCVGGMLVPLPAFALMAGGTLAAAAAGAAILAALGGGVSAVGAVATAEQFPGEGRLSGLALGTTTATALFGGLAPYAAAALVARTGFPLLPGALIAAVGLGVLPVFWAMRDPTPVLAARPGSPPPEAA